MIKYLLLRDNKQSGPYSCDELRIKGLKAYDLVWAEGKSAAWRYPSEVEELRSFAPVVEEQPFDRFYKKPAASQTAQNSSSATATASAVTATTSASTSTGSIAAASGSNTNIPARAPAELSSVPGKKIIYVTMPAGKNPPAGSNPGTREPARNAPNTSERQTTLNNSHAAAHVWAPPSAAQPFTPQQSAAAAPAVTSPIPASPAKSSPLPAAEDILSHTHNDWHSDVESSPRYHKKGGSSRGLQLLAVGLCIVALLAAGVFIGLSINRNNSFSKKIAFKKDTPPAPLSVTPPPNQHQGASGAVTAPSASLIGAAPAADSIKEQHPAEKSTNTGTTTPRNATVPHAGQKPPATGTRVQTAAQNTLAKDSAVMAYPASHREASHRTDIAVEKMDKDLIRNNLSNLVSIGASHFTVGAFGGISDLQLTVSNRSVYPLDLVVVEVQYIQANKKVFKTENLYFRGVGAGAALMQEAPKSTRGIKVQYKITLVNSKELGLSYSAL